MADKTTVTINKRIQKKLSDQQLSVYGLAKVLDCTPQNAEYVVKKKDLSADYKRLLKIADYLGCKIEDIID